MDKSLDSGWSIQVVSMDPDLRLYQDRLLPTRSLQKMLKIAVPNHCFGMGSQIDVMWVNNKQTNVCLFVFKKPTENR